MKPWPVNVEDLMTTAVVTARPEDEIELAWELMTKAGVRHLPVVDEHRRLVGILSDRDLLAALGRRASRSGPVSDHMTSPVHTIAPDTPAHEAATVMLDRRIGALPVVGEGGRLLGIVSETDLLEVARLALLAEPPTAP